MNPNPDWQEILRAAHAEPLDPAHYTAVRARVLAEIERTRRPWARLAWISGAAALAAVVIALLAVPRPALPPLHAVTASIPPAPAAPQPRPSPVHTVAAAARPHRREPITIKLQTADPNIVIYWIAD